MKHINVNVLAQEIKNIPPDVHLKEFIVARLYDNDLWYYGSYENENMAEGVAAAIGNGIVLLNPSSSSNPINCTNFFE